MLTEAFRDDGQVARLAEALRSRPDAGAAFVAEQDGEVVGEVQLSISWVDAASELVAVFVLSPLGVLPAHQRKGVGRALVDAAVAEAEQRGVPLVFLEGDPRYYARLGWEQASAFGFTAPSARIPDPGFQVVRLAGWQPWMTGALVYNDTFWSLDFVGLRGGREPAPPN